MKNYLILILIASLLSGCGTYYYYPTYQNVPTNTKENEISYACFRSGDNRGFNLSYSMTKNLGSFLTVNTFDNLNSEKATRMTDLGLYYFNSINIANNKNIKSTYSLTSAYGTGQNNRHDFAYALDIKRVFLQPTFTFQSKYVDFGLSSRFSYVDYKVEKFLGEKYKHLFDQLYDIGERGFLFFEPHMYIGIGYKWVKVNYHMMKVSKINSAKILYYDFRVGYLSLSFNLDLATIFN